jgi:hypothetical protein
LLKALLGGAETEADLLGLADEDFNGLEMMRFFNQKSGNNRKLGYPNLILTDAVNKITTC